MAADRFRVVVDTNVVVRGLVNLRSASGLILQAAEQREILLLLSKPVVDEYRAVLYEPELAERFRLDPERVELALHRMRYLADYRRNVRTRFTLPRDPRDEIFVELAIAAEATHIVSSDDDLLSLPAGHGDAAKRFRQRLPKTQIINPADFLGRYRGL